MDLSTLCAATCGQEKKACGRGNNHAGCDQHDYVPTTTGPGRGSVSCGLNTLRRDVERPRKNQRDWKSDEQQQNRRSDQFGNSHAGKVAEANWMMPPAAMM